jgi:hypothetical protein
MELVPLTSTQVKVVTPDSYRFHAEDYPIVYRKFVEYYKLHPDTTHISFNSHDSVLLQIIAIQHLLEPDIVIKLKGVIQIDASDHDGRALTLVRYMYREARRGQVSRVVVTCADDHSHYLGLNIFTWFGDAYDVSVPVLGDGETSKLIHDRQHKYDRCTFDFYKEIYRRLLVGNPDLKIILNRCGYDPYAIVHLCAVIAIGEVNLRTNLPLGAFQLVENARLKTLHIDWPDERLEYTPPEPPREWFVHGCSIQNFILAPLAEPRASEILNSFLTRVSARKCVRLNLGSYDREIAPGLFEVLFNERNTNLDTIVVKLYNLREFNESQILAATQFMNILSDMYINLPDPSKVCKLIWRDHGSFLGARRILEVVKSIKNDPFEGMVDYMWDKYTSVYHVLELDEDGYYEGILVSDSDESRIPNWNRFEPMIRVHGLNFDVYPIIQKKERFKAIITRQLGNNASLGRIFLYMWEFTKIMEYPTNDGFYSSPRALSSFFQRHAESIPVSDAFILRDLPLFYRAMDRHNMLWRIVSTGRRELLEPFTRGYGELLMDRIAPLLND